VRRVIGWTINDTIREYGKQNKLEEDIKGDADTRGEKQKLKSCPCT